MGWRRVLARAGAGTSDPLPRSLNERSGATEFFLQDQRATTLIVVVHISKTAGTALRRFVRANLRESETEVIHNLRYVARTPAERLEWFRDWYEALDDDKRARLCCVMSHWAGYLLPALDREVDALTLVRDPVDRTLSYYFFKHREPSENSLGLLARLGDERALDDWRRRPDGDLVDRLYNNWQSRALLSIFHDVSSLDLVNADSSEADVWRRRLRELVDEVFVVGVQDRLKQYVRMIARRYGWDEGTLPRAKVNRARPSSSDVSPALREAILTWNWLDRELHELSRQTQIEREADTVEPRLAV